MSAAPEIISSLGLSSTEGTIKENLMVSLKKSVKYFRSSKQTKSNNNHT